MRSTRPFVLAFALGLTAAWLPLSPAQGEDAGPPDCLVLDIHQIGPAGLAALTATAGIDTWIELDEELFVCGSGAALAELEQRASIRRSFDELQKERLRLAFKQSRAELEERGLRVLAAGGLFAVVETAESTLTPDGKPLRRLPFPSSLVLARQADNQPARRRYRTDVGTVAELVAEIDIDRWFADVESLAGYNRYTGGSEILEAHDWLMQQFESLPGLSVESHPFSVGSVLVANVIATLPGRIRPDDWFIVGAHYDSISNAPSTAAPGAEDNASGCAGVLEMARIFATHPPEATILFICYAGEEQGLFGSGDHVRDLLVSGDFDKVGAMLNLDMIGFSADSDLDCLLQSDSNGWGLIGALTDSAARHTSLRIVWSTSIGGSDHVPYAAFGTPAVMSIENDWSIYPHYHRSTDIPEHLNPEMAAEILRMNVGALARLTGNSDIAGCLEFGNEPLVGVGVSSKQSGASRQKTSSDRRGCFAVDPVVREKRFKLIFKGTAQPGEDRVLSACVRMLGDPVTNRRVIFRQSGAPARKTRSDNDGCFSFEATTGEGFTLSLKGPRVPAAAL